MSKDLPGEDCWRLTDRTVELNFALNLTATANGTFGGNHASAKCYRKNFLDDRVGPFGGPL